MLKNIYFYVYAAQHWDSFCDTLKEETKDKRPKRWRKLKGISRKRSKNKSKK